MLTSLMMLAWTQLSGYCGCFWFTVAGTPTHLRAHPELSLHCSHSCNLAALPCVPRIVFFSCLSALAVDSSIHFLQTAGTMHSLCTLLATHADDFSTVDTIFSLITRVARADTDSRRNFVSFGGIPLLVAALKVRSNADNNVSTLCWGIREICLEEGNSSALRQLASFLC